MPVQLAYMGKRSQIRVCGLTAAGAPSGVSGQTDAPYGATAEPGVRTRSCGSTDRSLLVGVGFVVLNLGAVAVDAENSPLEVG